MLVIVAALLLPVVAGGAHVGAQSTDECGAGLVVGSGESCTYPGSSLEFSVDSSGRGRFLFFTSGSSIAIENSTINGVVYNFVARAQGDGTWLIETARRLRHPHADTDPHRDSDADAHRDPDSNVYSYDDRGQRMRRGVGRRVRGEL